PEASSSRCGALPSIASRISLAFEASPFIACTNCAIATASAKVVPLRSLSLRRRLSGMGLVLNCSVPVLNRMALGAAGGVTRLPRPPRLHQVGLAFLTYNLSLLFVHRHRFRSR